MNRRSRFKKRILAGLASMAVAASLLTILVASADPPPTVHFEGLELRMVADYKTDEHGNYVLDGQNQRIPEVDQDGKQRQSVQALVSIAISNVAWSTGGEFPLYYNPDYLRPSDWETNGELQSVANSVDPANEMHHAFFHVDEELYAGKDPFNWTDASIHGQGSSTVEVTPSTSSLSLHLTLGRYLPIPTSGKNKVREYTWTERGGKKDSDNYIDSTEKTVLGTISFRVNDELFQGGTAADREEQLKQTLQELVAKFNKTDGTAKDGSGDVLLHAYRNDKEGTPPTGREAVLIWELKKAYNTANSAASRNRLAKETEYKINVASEDVIMKAEPVNHEVTINAYEAFTNGEVSDLALAMQKYAEAIRVTYVSEKQADMSIYWGDPDDTSYNMPDDGPGMFIQKDGSDEVYRFKWDPADKTRYTFEKKQSDGSFTTVDPSDFQYDPRGGVYKISQYFTYMENGGVPGVSDNSLQPVLKTYQTPIEVKLTVTPVKAVGAVVDKDSITYRNDIQEVPSIYSALELADEARIVLDTTLNGVFPTVPVAWTPGTLDRNVTGVPGVGNTASVATWPFAAAHFADKSGIGDYTFTTEVKETDAATLTGVRDCYPWLTTDPWLNDGNDHKVSLTSMRYIVDTDTTELASRYVAWAEPYELPLGDEIGRLRVTIARQNEDGTDFEDMATGYKFHLYMPNGMEIQVDPVQWFGPSTGANTWHDGTTNAEYQVQGPTGMAIAGGKEAYTVTLSPGNLGATDAYAAEREILRRYINLGGWFGVKVQAPGQTGWTDLIPAFSQPRTNIYIHSYDDTDQRHFDYTDKRMGLMPFYKSSNLPTFVTLPADETVATRYDALDGHQPGALRQFKVGAWNNVSGDKGHTAPDWAVGDESNPSEIVTYGADLFARTYDYGDLGEVVNPDAASGYAAVVVDRTAMVKVQVQDGDDPATDPDNHWDLLLTYEQDAGDNITYIHNATANVDEVKRVTFETKQEGYTYQQIVTLTLTNNGDQEIRGLHVDVPTLSGASGPYFTIVSAPPTTLPVGAKATFQISYVQNLNKGTYGNLDTTVPVEIHHDNGDKTFEALIRITESKLHRVTIVVHPDSPTEGRVMGDAGLVVGVETDTVADVDTYDGGEAGVNYETDERFWVLTTPEDEYAILTLEDESGVARPQVYYLEDYTDDLGQPAQRKVYLNEYLPEGGNPDFATTPVDFRQEGNERLFWAPMPNQSVEVHVHYYEPLLSKLRLSDLHAYAWEQKDQAVWDDTAVPPQWEDEPDPAQPSGLKYEKQLHEPQSGNYNVITFDPQKDEYIVILDDEDTGDDNWIGVSVKLRNLTTHISGVGPDYENLDITPTVIMTLDDGPHTVVGGEPSVGDTTGPTTHHSQVLEAPTAVSAKNGIAEKTVIITIAYDGTGLVPPEGVERRVYRVRFVRKINGEARKVLAAGNSPYGMIENDATITDKAAAKAAFSSGYRFTAGYKPHQATELTNIYWPEAWEGGTNYDEDVTALFIYLGQEFYDPGASSIYNNAGDLIDNVTVTRTLGDYYQMDTTQTTAMDRFSGGSVVATEIDLGTVLATNGAIPGETVAVAATSVTDLRPGVYRLTYTFEDYDHQTQLYFTRPLIVLSPNGDVDADQILERADADAIRKRFRTALPLEMADVDYSAGDKLVYKYRIVDANNDRNINNVDANLIRKVTALILPSEPLTQFYRPTDYIYPALP